jgi:hypothetical protein
VTGVTGSGDNYSTASGEYVWELSKLGNTLHQIQKVKRNPVDSKATQLIYYVYVGNIQDNHSCHWIEIIIEQLYIALYMSTYELYS